MKILKALHNRYFLILLSIIILNFHSCEETFEWYIGLNKQPEFFDDQGYVSVLNVMGVLRPESEVTGTGSFVRVEETGPSNLDTSLASGFVLKNATVFVSSQNLQEDVEFIYTETEYDVYGGRYQPNDINIIPGATYNLRCIHADYDTLYGSTTVPDKPELLSISYDKQKKGLNLLLNDSQFGEMYQALLLSDSIEYSDYAVSSDQIVLSIGLSKGIPSEGILQVYSYDKNLANYFSSVTSSIINLNSYRPPFKEVAGGYGVFGSLNMTQFRIEDLDIQRIHETK